MVRTGKEQNDERMECLSWRSFLHQRWKILVIGILAAAFLEVGLFNLPTWQTLGARTQTVPSSEMSLTGLERIPGGLKVTNPKTESIDIASKDGQLIRFLRFVNSDAPAGVLDVSVNYQLADFYGHDLTQHDTGTWVGLFPRYSRSEYINAGGICSHLRVLFQAPQNAVIPFSAVQINPRVPYSCNGLRIAVLLTLVLLLAFLGPGSPLWRVRLETRSAFQISVLAIATLLILAYYGFIWGVSGSVTEYVGLHFGAGFEEWFDYNQYGSLADALVHGRTWLDLPVPRQLAAMKNPYDYAARVPIVEHGGKVFWDHAFYHGRYYCYFGVVPAVLFFVPYQLMTGQMLPSAVSVLICSLVGAVFATLLMVRVAELWFQQASPAAVLAAVLMMGMGSGILYHVFTASFYSVPESCSYMLTLGGLWCWLMSLRQPEDSARPARGGEPAKAGKPVHVSAGWIFAGSALIALDFGSRPQYLFSALLAVPIFWDAVFHDRTLFSRRGLRATISAIIPFALVFLPLMLYNKTRFGSLFSFGADYNLTGFDMVHAKRTFLGTLSVMWYFLFQPMNLNMQFPFVNCTTMPFFSWHPSEPSEGGLFTFLAPFALLVFALPWIFSRRRRSSVEPILKPAGARGTAGTRMMLAGVCLTGAAAVLAVLFLDSYMCGFTERYMNDFGYLIILMTAIALYALTPADEMAADSELAHRDRLLAGIVCALLAYVFLVQFFAVFTVGRYGSLLTQNPQAYTYVADWFLFMD